MTTVRFLFLAALLLAGSHAGAARVFDVIVTGSEPEGVAAAVAAAEEGASVLLVTEHPRIGGLFVMGEMNSLDVRTTPVNYQQGLFLNWWKRVGQGHSFDVLRAERAFEDMLGEAGVEVLRSVSEVIPLFPLTGSGEPDLSAPVGVEVDGRNYFTKQLVDATAEADIAAAAGARFTFGFESLGLNERMADTLVFRIAGVDWSALSRGIRRRGNSYATVDNHVAWGHFGGYPANYRAVEDGIRLRGLNMGRQDDGSLLVNALLIHHIDPFDPASVAAGRERAIREAPRIVEYLKQELPGFADARYAGAAETLYVRETRHLDALCLLTADDVLDSRVTDRAVAAGGYPLDVQVLTPADNGYVFGTPAIYGAELCMNVPRGLGNAWVAGKAAGFDPIAHSSARVVPFGMAIGEAVGVAAALGARTGLTPAQVAESAAAIAEVRKRLEARGAWLPPVEDRNPVGPFRHPHHEAYRVLLGHGLALGGYTNEPGLDGPATALSYVYMLSNVGKRFLGNDMLGPGLLAEFSFSTEPLTPDAALAVTARAACRLSSSCPAADWEQLYAAGLGPHVPDLRVEPESTVLTRGQMYELAVSLLRWAEAQGS